MKVNYKKSYSSYLKGDKREEILTKVKYTCFAWLASCNVASLKYSCNCCIEADGVSINSTGARVGAASDRYDLPSNVKPRKTGKGK